MGLIQTFPVVTPAPSVTTPVGGPNTSGTPVSIRDAVLRVPEVPRPAGPSLPAAPAGENLAAAPTRKNLAAERPQSVLLPTAHAAMTFQSLLMGDAPWSTSETGTAAFARAVDPENMTEIMVDCSAPDSLKPVQGILQIAETGPALVRTFHALSNLWLERNTGQPQGTCLTVSPADLLRFMGHRQKHKGGYDAVDLARITDQTGLLSRIVITRGRRDTYVKGARKREWVRMGPLIVLNPAGPKSGTTAGGTFAYRLGPEAYGWFLGERRQFTTVGGALLGYHPGRGKLHISLAVALAYYRRVNANKGKPGQGVPDLALTSLFRLAGLAAPGRNLGCRLEAARAAVAALDRDGVLPGVVLVGSRDKTVTDRQAFEVAKVQWMAYEDTPPER